MVEKESYVIVVMWWRRFGKVERNKVGKWAACVGRCEREGVRCRCGKGADGAGGEI